MIKLNLIFLVILSASLGISAPRNLIIQDLACHGAKVKSFAGEPDSGINLLIYHDNNFNPPKVFIDMRTGTGPAHKWVSSAVAVTKVSPNTGGGYLIKGIPQVRFAGGGTASFDMNIIKLNGVWNASTKVVYKASMRPASIREYKLICSDFEVR